MKVHPLATAAILLAMALPTRAGEPALVRVYDAPAPKLDGALDDPCWERASTILPFLDASASYPAAEPTTLLLSFDKDTLYAGFDCQCLDSQKLRIGDGDPALNDRVELVLRFATAPEITVLVDAAGRIQASKGLEGAKAAVGRRGGAYTVELAVPRPSDTRILEFVARRFNEVTGEESAWGTDAARAQAQLVIEPGPAVKIMEFPRRPGSKDNISVRTINPRDTYSPIRCRVSLSENVRLMPVLVRLEAKQTMTTKVRYDPAEVGKTGVQLVFDEPQGTEVYLRTASFRLPPGGALRARRLDVIPQPQTVKIEAVATPFLLDRRCVIVVGRRTNETERYAAELLRSEIKELCGLDLSITRRSYFIPYPSIVVATDRTTLLAKRIRDRFGLKWQETVPDQCYVLGVQERLIGVAGMNDVGTLYGAQTLAQILASSPHDKGSITVPAMTIRDYPDLLLRGALLRGGLRADLPALYPALSRFKVNLVNGIPDASLPLAERNGIYNAVLALPSEGGLGMRREPAMVRMTPSEAMERLTRRSLRLPITLEEGTIKPPPEPTPEELEAEKKRLADEAKAAEAARIRQGKRPSWMSRDSTPLPEDPLEMQPAVFAWVRGDPAALCDVASVAEDRLDIVGLCGGLRKETALLPPSWLDVVAAAEYGWSTRVPPPGELRTVFARSFYGSAAVGEARDLLERAVACLPRQTALADLLTDTRPAPAAPRDDLPALVDQAATKATFATRNKDLAALLAASGPRVLAAATNVATALRVRTLYAEARELAAQKRPADAAARLQAIADSLAQGGEKAAKLLVGEAAMSADVKLYTQAAAAAKALADQVAKGGELPGPERFWPLLRGEAR